MVDDLEIELEVGRKMGGRAALFVPLLLRERAIGVITVVDKIGPDPRFSDDDLRLAEAFAGRAAAAVDLSGRVARDALRRVVAGQELERTRLARELHDETGQALTSILLGLRTIQEADDLDEAVEDVRAARRLDAAERAPARGRAAAERARRLRARAGPRAAHGVRRRAGRACRSTSRLSSARQRLPGDVETALYRIVQEALTNAIKHAGAASVERHPHPHARIL